MNRLRGCMLVAALSCVGLAGPGSALSASGFGDSTPPAAAAAQKSPLRFESDHEGRFGGTKIRYKATVEETFLEDAGGQAIASIVSISYVRTDVPEGEVRPVIFVFNGGPGSASLWLHMGFVGPRRIDFTNDVAPETTPPFRLTDNAESPLDVADIVLYDPPGTGFSRILAAGKEEQFFGVEQDAQATADFIESWMLAHDRWNSPKYLMGESYGTIRAAVVAKLLAGGPFGTGSMNGITLNGVILLGQSMDHSGADDGRFLNSLPSLAATAWYHKDELRAGGTLDEHVEAARVFAAGDYQDALYAGWDLDAAAKNRIANELSALIGISAAVILEHDLRMSNGTFAELLLAKEGREVGMYDSRYTLPLANDGNDPVADDPAMGQYVPGFVAALNQHLRDDLEVTIDEPYRAIEFRSVNARWNYGYGPGVPPSRSFSGDLATAARRNPDLRIFVGTGYYDLVTTLGSAEYTFAHSGIAREAVRFRNYESGHMPYLGEDSRLALAEDLRRFVTSRLAAKP
ncbi:MAG: S10 family peptidase [Gammaproteobacteria bacterium]